MQEIKVLKLHNPIDTNTLWCFGSYIENSTYMKVIFTKKLTFINIIYQTKFQFVKMSGSLGNLSLKSPFIVHKSHRNSKNYIFFMVLELFANWNLVNNNDKSKLVKRTFM